MQRVIDHAVHVRLIATTPGAHAVPAVLHYHPADPFAVRIAFPPEISLDGSAVEWTFARELLREGMDTPTGTGDVRVRPLGRSRMLLELHVDDGVAMVQMNAAEIRVFLERSYDAVPAGREARHLDLDRGLAELFSEG